MANGMRNMHFKLETKIENDYYTILSTKLM